MRKRVLIIVTAVFLTQACLGRSSAALLYDVEHGMLDYPDIQSEFIDASYNASTDQLVIHGDARTLDDDGVGGAINIYDASGDPDTVGSYDIVATVDDSGTLSSGTITVSGSVPSLSLGDPLLTGTLTQFGYRFRTGTLRDRLQFVFIVTGGSAASLFNQVAVAMQAGTNITQLNLNENPLDPFGANFSTVGIPQGLSDTAPVVPTGHDLHLDVLNGDDGAWLWSPQGTHQGDDFLLTCLRWQDPPLGQLLTSPRPLC